MVLQVDSHVSTVAQVIQLSVAPVFLFSGVGTMLVVLTNRLARIVDRTRALRRNVDEPDRSGDRRDPAGLAQ